MILNLSPLLKQKQMFLNTSRLITMQKRMYSAIRYVSPSEYEKMLSKQLNYESTKIDIVQEHEFLNEYHEYRDGK